MLQGFGEAAGADTYSWVAQKQYQTDACDTLFSTLHFPLETCICSLDKCQIWSKSGANTITFNYFAATDTLCQSPEKTEKTETVVTDVCSSSLKYEFAGDGPGAVEEAFASKTCDPGTGKRVYVRLDTCLEGGTSSAKMVCESGKINLYSYTSANCTAGKKSMLELGMGECFSEFDLDAGRGLRNGESASSALLFKSGC